MSDTVAPEPPSDRSARQQVLLGAEISDGGGLPSKHRVKNLSATGARVDRAGKLAVDSIILVSIGVLGAIQAKVVWVKDDLAGLSFANPIDPDAARGKSIVAAKATAPTHPIPDPATGPKATAGWVGDLASPYRK